MVRVIGLEPTASASRTLRATNCATPWRCIYYTISLPYGLAFVLWSCFCFAKAKDHYGHSIVVVLLFVSQKAKDHCGYSKKTASCLFVRILVVWVTGLEPATSTSQKSRATNCATPRRYFYYSTFYLKRGNFMVE